MEKIKIGTLGGVNENGKNLFIVEVDDEIYILDAGFKFPETDLLGIDIVIPDLSYIIDNVEKVAGVFLTHGHFDAYGAIPYLLSKVDVPVFGSQLTIDLAKDSVKKNPDSKHFNDFHVISESALIDFEKASVSFFKTTHTIPDSLGISISTKSGEIVYTGDFRFDPSATPEYATSFDKIAKIGNKKVIALLSDSMNVDSPIANPTERKVFEYIVDTFRDNQESRIIVASAVSNLLRMQQIFDAAVKTNKKIILTGKGLKSIVKLAIKEGALKLPNDDLLVEEKDMAKLDRSETVIIETGQSGEPISELKRMAENRHPNIHIEEGDLVFVTTSTSPTMDTIFAKVRDQIYRVGGSVVSIEKDIHSSGHADANTLQLLIDMLHPENLFPVHGEFRLLDQHKNIAMETGVSSEHIHLMKKGDMLKYEDGNFTHEPAIPAEDVMIDGHGIGQIGSVVLHDRTLLAQDGVFIAVVTIDRRHKKIVSEPKINTEGFVYNEDNPDFLKKSAEIMTTTINKSFESKSFDWGELKQDIRDKLSKYIYDQTKRHPVVMPVVMEVSQNSRRHFKKNTTAKTN